MSIETEHSARLRSIRLSGCRNDLAVRMSVSPDSTSCPSLPSPISLINSVPFSSSSEQSHSINKRKQEKEKRRKGMARGDDGSRTPASILVGRVNMGII